MSRRQRPITADRGICPTEGKDRFTATEALAVAAYLRRGNGPKSHEDCHTYLCKACGWHHTGRKGRTGMKRPRPPARPARAYDWRRDPAAWA